MVEDARTALSRLPQVDALLRQPEGEAAVAAHGHRTVAGAIRVALDDARARIRDGGGVPEATELLGTAVAAIERRRAGRLTKVVNATGVVLHTNLGRAPLAAAARDAVTAAAGYSSLEFDLASGQRGSRTAHLGTLVAEAAGTEAATVVNNGAAALVLVLAALARGRGVVVSRGELIEIGGSYRLPEMMEAAGARLVEVGTTNRTRVADYRAAVDDDTALLLKVHRSNYRVVGFTEEASVAELCALGREAGIPLVHDLGSGLLRDQPDGPLAGEPSVAASVAAGADLVVFSGDKLLGGPQAGVIAGRGDLLLRCSRHPFARAMRVDKLQRAALEATLEAHLRRDVPLELPVMAMLHADLDTLKDRAVALADRLAGEAQAVPVEGLVGGGALPGVTLASWAIALPDADPSGLAARLRRGAPPVVVRIEDDRVLLDLRTVPPAQDDDLADLVRVALA